MVMASPRSVKEDLDPRVDDEKIGTRPVQELIEVSVSDVDPLRKLKIGFELDRDLKENMIDFLKKNLDVFAWTHDDMEVIDSEVMSHRLNVGPKFLPKRQKCGLMNLER